MLHFLWNIALNPPACLPYFIIKVVKAQPQAAQTVRFKYFLAYRYFRICLPLLLILFINFTVFVIFLWICVCFKFYLCPPFFSYQRIPINNSSSRQSNQLILTPKVFFFKFIFFNAMVNFSEIIIILLTRYIYIYI